MAAPLLVILLAVLPQVAVSTSSQGLPGPFNVKSKAMWDYTGPCGPGIVYYPDSDGQFPLLSFAHGLGAGNVKVTYSYTINAVASWGYIIVALEGCASSPTEWKAQEATMDWAFSHWTTIDHSKPGGIFGHSMGGGSTIAVAGNGDACQHYGLQGAFMMHPCNFQTGSGGPSWIPSLYVSGQSDGTCSPRTTYGEYQNGGKNGKPRGYAVYKGYSHASPCGPGFNLEAMDIANWFGCYLYGNQDSCGAIYSGFCNNKIPTGQTYGCELFMNGLTSGNLGDSEVQVGSFDTLWKTALETGNPQEALAVPWGHHNGTLEGVVHEVKVRGAWVVQQRSAYLRARGLYPQTPGVNASKHLVLV